MKEQTVIICLSTVILTLAIVSTLTIVDLVRPDLMPAKTIFTAIDGNHYDIQKAIDDCFKKGSGVIHIPDGVYAQEETLYGRVSKYFSVAGYTMYAILFLFLALNDLLKILKP